MKSVLVYFSDDNANRNVNKYTQVFTKKYFVQFYFW